MKKSQVSVFVIIGIIILISVGFFILARLENRSEIYLIDNQKILTMSDARSALSNYVFYCIRDSAEKVFQDTGIREETLSEFEDAVSEKVKSCTKVMLLNLKKEKYDVSEGDIKTVSIINPETVSIDVTYPLSLEYEGQKMELKEFSFMFDRATTKKIGNGVTEEEITLISSNRKAQITIPKGVEVRDGKGNPVTELGIKVDDLHFDGLENMYVLGQLVYDASPDGVTFSEPVELTIEFRDEDIPEGYTTDNLMISYWNENDGIWYAVDTEISGNKATAKITHLSKWSISILGFIVIEDRMFQQRYSPYGAGEIGSKDGVWTISGSENTKGTASLQSTYPDIGAFKAYNGFEDFRKTIDNNGFIIKPKVEFGYYTDPESRSGFVNCELSGVSEGTKYGLDGNGDPYFELKGCIFGYTCSDLPCPLTGVVECNNAQYCSSSNSNLACIPFYSDREAATTSAVVPSKQENNMSCCRISYDDYFDAGEVVQEFGWHNYQCAGGRVRPADNYDFSDFIVFAPKGNAVVKEDSIKVFAKPPVYWQYEGPGAYLKLSDILLFNGDYSEEPIDEDALIPFYCNIVPYATGEEFKQIGTSATEQIKNKLGLSETTRVAAYGVYGLDIIKRTDHDLAKTELHTECLLYWKFKGNGVLYSNPSEGLSQTLAASELEATQNKIINFFSNLINKG